ncbi:AAA family ATPase [Kribbella speibonae]|uniref:AAA family ATPase n=1 Tax=Kribbella speibonae TaxID=1572660 RepID=A0A4R0J6C0_9ACTN|nr:AAA family ATPase [Kribbella speibonae]TCC41130.1 AAA family ATPase [Kribbella speibonae]
MAKLPAELAVLFEGDPAFDVVGAEPPYVVTPEWLDATKAKIADLVDRPTLGRVSASNKYFIEGSPLLVDTFYFVFKSLWPALGILVGGARNLHFLLLNQWREEQQEIDTDIANWRETGASFDIPYPLRRDRDSQEEVIRACREMLDLLIGIPGLEARRKAMASMLDHVLASPELLDLHLTQSRPAVLKRWIEEFGNDDIRQIYPNLSGNPLDLMVYGVNRLQAAYTRIAAVTPEAEKSFAEEIASLLQQIGRTDLPAGLSFSALGPSGTAEVQTTLETVKTRPDPAEWRRRRQAWMIRAVEAGAAYDAREYLAATYQVGASLNGLPDKAKASKELYMVAGFFRGLRDLHSFRPPKAVPTTIVEAEAPDKLRADVPVAGDPIADLNEMTGLGAVKARVHELVAEAKVAKLRAEAGLRLPKPMGHLVFSGNPGTGKTTVARILAEVYRDLGMLSSGHLVEVGRADLIASYIGQTAPRVTEVVERALGGVLFIDEAYSLFNTSGRDFGREAVATLIQLMETHRDNLVVVMAGYPNEMYSLVESNPGLKSRIRTFVNFPDYTDGELHRIFLQAAEQAGFVLGAGVSEQALATLHKAPRAPGFGNARTVRTLLERIATLQAVRLATLESPTMEQVRTIERSDVAELTDENLGDLPRHEDPRSELTAMTGLTEVKATVERLAAEAQADVLRSKAGMPPTERSRHMVFTGNPGTGKTTVARLLAEIYRDLGLLGVGHLVETSGNELMGQYVGQTSPKVKRLVEQALGGVLFIDEAYTLADARGYGAEALATLIKLMEEHREDLVVVLAGYTEPMEGLFLQNPGLRSRVPTTLEFPDYSSLELQEIFEYLSGKAGYLLADGVVERVGSLLDRIRHMAEFGNGRDVRNLFEATVSEQAVRIGALTDPSVDQLRELTPADVPADWQAKKAAGAVGFQVRK